MNSFQEIYTIPLIMGQSDIFFFACPSSLTLRTMYLSHSTF